MTDGESSSAAVRFIVLYHKPADEASFMERFERVHAPLLREIPHLRDLRISSVSHNRRALQSGYFLMVEMIFEDPTRFAEAMCSRERRVASADLKGFADEPVTLIALEG